MLVLGAKGFAKQLLEIFIQLGKLENLYFYDDISKDIPNYLYNKYPIIKSIKEAEEIIKLENSYCLGIGNPLMRYKLAEKFNNIGAVLTSVISPHSYIGIHSNSIGVGVNILTGVIIENNVTIGAGAILNLKSTITHDTIIGKYSEIAPGVHISGGCIIGDFCSIGTGAVLIPRVKLGQNVTIGAGAVVVNDIEDNSIAAGVPAKTIRKKEPIKI